MAKMIAVLSAALVSLAGAAQAQDTTTTCRNEFGRVVCDTSQSSGAAALAAQQQAFDAMMNWRRKMENSNSKPMGWSRDGATYDEYLQQRYSCLRDASSNRSAPSASMFNSCMTAFGWYRNDNGFVAPANALVSNWSQ